MLENLKLLLGLSGENDTVLDTKLRLILNGATRRLKRLLGGIEPPEEMEDIIVEVAIKRFNRIGSEGLDSHSEDGESLSFSDGDFDEFSGEIQAWLNAQKDSKRGKVRFI
jgi:hypothetical protein